MCSASRYELHGNIFAPFKRAVSMKERDMNLKYGFVILVVLLSSSVASAQQWLKVDSLFNPSGVAVQNFSGPEFADLDGDGDVDLLLGNSSSSRVDFFRSHGNGVPPRYVRDTTVLASIFSGGNSNTDYPVVCDIDGDRDFDLVVSGYNGILFYKNVGDTLVPQWQRIDTLFAQVNTLIGTDAKPAFADLDGDSDYDLLVGIGESLFGGPEPGLTFGFRNTGSRTAPQFALDAALVAGIPDIGRNSYPTLKDIDGDSDLDLLLGRDLATLVYYRNTGSVANPVWTGNSTTFNSVEGATYWKQPVLFDLDKDGDFDLTYGTSDGTMYYYENTGTSTAPQFQYRPTYFPVIRTDGNGATSSLADFDNDGDFDLMSGDWLGRLQYFRNDGTRFAPRFTKTTSSFTSIDVGSYSTPTFVDLDGDNDKDVVSGALDGMIYCYINNGTGFTQNTTMFSGIDVGYLSSCAFADLDADSDLDVVIGAEDAGAISAYRNQGSNVFAPDAVLINGVTSVRNGYPTFVDLDRDGDYDLVIGGLSGQVLYYQNTGTRQSPAWARDDSWMSGVRVRQNASLSFADMDGDTKADVVVGEYNGNFSYYRNQLPTSVALGNDVPARFELLQNYPNPFNPSTTIEFSVSTRAHAILKVFDLLGREVGTLVNDHLTPGVYRRVFDASGLSTGLYIYRLQAGEFTQSNQMTFLK